MKSSKITTKGKEKIKMWFIKDENKRVFDRTKEPIYLEDIIGLHTIIIQK